jgi:hypothetical protein
MHPLHHLALPDTANSGPLRRVTGLTTSGTNGNRTTVTHGLTSSGKPVTPTVVILVPTGAADADGALTEPGRVYEVVASRNSTTLVVRGTAASVPFTLYVG